MLLVFLLCLALAACTAAPVPVTLTPTRLPATPQPTATPSPQPLHTPTYPPATTGTVDTWATQVQQMVDASATQSAGFPAVCEGSRDLPPLSSFSPDHNWMAAACNLSAEQSLEIVNKDGRQWVLPFRDFLAEEDLITHEDQPSTTPLGGLSPIYWTSDNVYLYFASYILGRDGGELCYSGSGYQGLFQLNLNSGSVAPILAATTSHFGYQFSFSPDGRWLAYTYQNEQPVILNLKTGESISVQPGGEKTGGLTWAPDGSQLAYPFCEQDLSHFTIVRSGIKVYSPKTQTLTLLLLKIDGKRAQIAYKQDGGLLKIMIEENGTDAVHYQFYDWPTGQMTTPTPTPVP